VGDNTDKSQILKDDETEWSTENEDELADKLLTQFPTYGSAEPTNTDWLSEENDTTEDGILEEEINTPHTTTTGVAGVTSSTALSSTRDWDVDEQSLWKGNATTIHGDTRKDRSTALVVTSTNGDVRKDRLTAVISTPTSLAGVSFYTQPKEDDSQLQPAQQQAQNDDRQHWMPDTLCKICYACELPFTGMYRGVGRVLFGLDLFPCLGLG